MAKLQLAKLAAGWFLANLESGKTEQWTSVRLRVVLVQHGYSHDEADIILEQAEAAPEMEILLPDPRPS
jgi:hypothetical protein